MMLALLVYGYASGTFSKAVRRVFCKVDSPLGNPPQLRLVVIDVVRRLKRVLLVIGGLLARNCPTNSRRRKFLCEPDNVELLRTAFRIVKSAHPFTIDAFVLLPEHLHCIWTLPPDDHDYPMRWNAIKNHFTRHARMTLNYRHHRPNDVNGRKPSGNHATGNTKSGTTATSKNIAITFIGTR